MRLKLSSDVSVSKTNILYILSLNNTEPATKRRTIQILLGQDAIFFGKASLFFQFHFVLLRGSLCWIVVVNVRVVWVVSVPNTRLISDLVSLSRCWYFFKVLVI